MTTDQLQAVAGPAGGVGLLVDWCDYEAAEYSTRRWHYSRRMPRGKLATFGCWEDGRFVGAVVFGYGATPAIGSPFGLAQNEIVELCRVALRDHRTPVTATISRALQLLKARSPGLRLVVSFADTAHGHHGGIYQAGNWIYLGEKQEAAGAYKVRGQIVHPRTLYSRYGIGGQSIPWLRKHVDPNAERIRTPVKHKYVMPLDRAMRRRVRRLGQDYPAPQV